ncbi:hypothetical protein, partial [Pseudomonas ceruminis]|uniref:hypothetical protein n=1 Tax=Pseudomonas ceruminis TaxID=2740516 RepID=UPI0020070448
MRQIAPKPAHKRAAAIKVMRRDRPVRQPGSALALMQGRERINKRNTLEYQPYPNLRDPHHCPDCQV